MATSVIPTSNAALTMYMGYCPNGVSVMNMSPGLYRTDGNHLPSEGVVGNTYGTLLILNTNENGYKFVMYVGLQGQSGVFSTLNHNWHQTSSAGSLSTAESGMATSRIPYDKMGGYKLIEWNDTTPDAVNTEYRQSIPGASSSGYAACVGVMVMNKSNNAWYQLPQAGWMNGGLLRFTISDPVYAGQPFHAVILSK